MLCGIICAVVSATILSAFWVPCCLVMCGCVKPEISCKTIQFPFFYVSNASEVEKLNTVKPVNEERCTDHHAQNTKERTFRDPDRGCKHYGI